MVTTGHPTRRLLRRVALLLVGLAAVVLTGCATSATPSSEPGSSTVAQSDLRPPVSARTGDPAAPTSVTADGQTAPTESVATDASGALLPPQDVGHLGWWVDSALPGSGMGTVVITGHIDDVDQGRGFAARFGSLMPGSEVTVQTAGGEKVRYRVRDVQTADKENAFPAAQLNRLDGPETLALVTCGGPFVGPPLGYRDNIIAWAVRS
ncbi:class F sortase [Gordonia sp. N1V]|nr:MULTISPECIES: class F sortase [unclassified Gordonia (in: high G+C Gram-positive bacteria)]MDF3281823.1 class F sortase [Gordonia sp. N1V]